MPVLTKEQRTDIICDQYIIDALWNKVMLTQLLFGKEKTIALLRAQVSNPIAQDLAVRVELTDKPYLI